MKNKGFTLIELLAVILILGIIALIAIPSVNKVVDTAKKGATETSAQSFVSAVNDKIMMNQIDSDRTNDIADGKNIDITTLGIEMEGKAPTSGVVDIENGQVVSATLNFDGYSVECNKGEGCVATRAAAHQAVITYKYWSECCEIEGDISARAKDRATQPSYVKVILKDGVYDDMEACFRYSSSTNEHCFKHGTSNFASNVEYIKNYFGFNNSWTKSGTYYYKTAGDTSLYCETDSLTNPTYFSCQDSVVSFYAAKTGQVDTTYYYHDDYFGCSVTDETFASCDGGNQ